MHRHLILLTKQSTRAQSPSATSSAILRSLRSRFSTAASSSAPTPPPFSSLQEQYRKDILDVALQNVHQYGWTEDAIAHSVVSNKNKYPPSFIGMMNDNHSKASNLIHYFMKECNFKLKVHLEDSQLHDAGGGKDNETMSPKIMTHAELLEHGIKHRLQMVLPFVQSSRWSEGMALGATPYNAMSTATHLEELVSTLEGALLNIPTAKEDINTRANLSPLERTAIGAVYVTTELHLLADTSPGYQDTWKFLHDRIQELDWIQQQQQQNGGFPPVSIPQLNQDTVIAGVAVASSLGSAVLSLMTPVARTGVSAVASSVVPQAMNFMSYASSAAAATAAAANGEAVRKNDVPGTTVEDYDVSNLPPFDPEGGNSKQ
eukprot:CAMPEP_0203665504 /NCGR_PEP_ID=MMETSP0090-20130426/2718_1 /ASSEMBLY_ACC=CAM_ASM_001088 /TAXON_ID=426623 /ORGANISM="Chaetoceros affinis, Strain CCMP159" /LENGTH=373 /DNA_ID=CAMNT_0050529091 /DNA_START=72 /DNA_END=1193 /DNA_ORIENTATION=+